MKVAMNDLDNLGEVFSTAEELEKKYKKIEEASELKRKVSSRRGVGADGNAAAPSGDSVGAASSQCDPANSSTAQGSNDKPKNQSDDESSDSNSEMD